jgi:hypothetical protein
METARLETFNSSRRVGFAIAGSLAATTGCATISTVDYLLNGVNSAVIMRSITIFPPASEQKVTAFVIWNPTGGNVSEIKRESGGALSTTVTFKAGTDFQAAGPMFSDASVSAGVKYRYTLKVGTKERVNSIEPVSAATESPALTSPGIGSLKYYAQPGASESAAVKITDGKPEFKWSAMTGKDASQSYGVFIICGEVDKTSQLGLKPRYSAFLEEASHSTGVSYGTKSDLTGFSTELLDYMKQVPALKDFAPVDSEKAGLQAKLPKGEYAWTLLTVNSDTRHISFGIGKPSAPTDAKHFLFFQVP